MDPCNHRCCRGVLEGAENDLLFWDISFFISVFRVRTSLSISVHCAISSRLVKHQREPVFSAASSTRLNFFCCHFPRRSFHPIPLSLKTSLRCLLCSGHSVAGCRAAAVDKRCFRAKAGQSGAVCHLCYNDRMTCLGSHDA